MKNAEVNRFNRLYQRHLELLKLQGKSQKTIDAYSRAIRRVRDHFDCCPDQKAFSRLSPIWTGAARKKAMKVVVEECGIKKRSRSIPCATVLLPTFLNAARSLSSHPGPARPCQSRDNSPLYSFE